MLRPFEAYLLCLLEVLLSANALAGGALLILEPKGSFLRMDQLWLIDTPFHNYLIPGIILLVFNGIFPLLALIGLLFKPDWKWANIFNIYKNRYWAWTYSLYTGIILITWISIELLVTQYFWLQPVLILLGLLIIVFTLLPRVIRFYSN
jgi:hypothetical protein